MKELKEHQPPMTIEEQVENLKKIGLIVQTHKGIQFELKTQKWKLYRAGNV